MLNLFRQNFFSKMLALFLAIFFARISFASDSLSKSLILLEEKIGQAKILYYDFQFQKSEKLLNEVIDSLKALPNSPAVNHDLSEAYLRIALNQDAQSQAKPRQDSLYQSVSYEPNRELDPSQIAPSVIAQFNKAKQKYLLTNVGVTNNLSLSSKDVPSKKSKSESQALSQNSKKKSFFKTWPFFLIVGLVVAGAGAGAAIALSGGGGSGGGGSGPATVGGTPQ